MQHGFNVLRDCRSLIEEVGDGFKFESVTYKAGNGKERPKTCKDSSKRFSI